MLTTPDCVVHRNVICSKYTEVATKLAIKLNLMTSNECFQILSYLKYFKVRLQQQKTLHVQSSSCMLLQF